MRKKGETNRLLLLLSVRFDMLLRGCAERGDPSSSRALTIGGGARSSLAYPKDPASRCDWMIRAKSRELPRLCGSVVFKALRRRQPDMDGSQIQIQGDEVRAAPGPLQPPSLLFFATEDLFASVTLRCFWNDIHPAHET